MMINRQRSTKKIILLLILGLLFVCRSCSIVSNKTEMNIIPSAEIVTEYRDIDPFSKIDAGSTFNIVYLDGQDATELKIVASDNLMDRIMTEVRGETLYFEYKSTISISFKSVDSPTIYISPNELTEIDLSGEATFSAETLSVKELFVELSGASKATFSDLFAEKLRADLSGSSIINIAGDAEKQEIESSGSTDFYGKEFRTEETKVETSGGSNAHVYASRKLKADASGASAVNYYRTPIDDLQVETSGAGEINNESTEAVGR